VSTDAVGQIRAVLDSLNADDRRAALASLRRAYPIHRLEVEWNVGADVILEAIARAPDLTQRGVRGVLAEAVCKTEIIDRLDGWQDTTPDGNHPFDFRIRSGDSEVTIQVKLQRKQAGHPMVADQAAGLAGTDLYVVETQRTRAGRDRSGASTRPYRFGEFDILAVCMEPATRDWTRFRYTVARWLIPRTDDPQLIAVYQPVSLGPNDDWTDQLETCLRWLRSGTAKTIRGAADPASRSRRRNPPTP